MTTTVLAYFPSPAQGVWYLGPFPIRAYALCIIAGIIAIFVLAILVDVLILFVGRLVTPWSRAS